MIKAIVLITLLAVFAVLCVLVGVRDVQSIRRNARIWQSGVAATTATYSADVDGLAAGPSSCAHFGGFAWSFDLKLRYTTDDGQERTSDVRFFRFGSARDYSVVSAPGVVVFRGGAEPFEVRYLREAPDEASVSWAHHATSDSWIKAIFFFVAGAGFVAMGASIARRLMRGESVVLDLGD